MPEQGASGGRLGRKRDQRLAGGAVGFEVYRPPGPGAARKAGTDLNRRGAVDRHRNSAGQPDAEEGGNVQGLVRDLHMHRLVGLDARCQQRGADGTGLLIDVAVLEL